MSNARAHQLYWRTIHVLYAEPWRRASPLSLAEAVSLTAAASGWFCILTTTITAKSGGVQSMLRHVQLRGAAISPVSSQLRTRGSRPSPSPGVRSSAAEPGLRPGGLRWKRCAFALSTLHTQRPCQVECGRSLWVYSVTARSVNRYSGDALIKFYTLLANESCCSVTHCSF